METLMLSYPGHSPIMPNRSSVPYLSPYCWLLLARCNSYSLLILFHTSCSAAARLSPAAEAHFLAADQTPSSSSSPIRDGLRSWATEASCAARWELVNSDACTFW